MAGLLPSEGKLRGSPANILGRYIRPANSPRVFLFRVWHAQRFSSAPSIALHRRKHASSQRMWTAHGAREARDSCGFARHQTARANNIAQRIVTCFASSMMRREFFAAQRAERSRKASRIIARAKNFPHVDDVPIVRRWLRAAQH